MGKVGKEGKEYCLCIDDNSMPTITLMPATNKADLDGKFATIDGVQYMLVRQYDTIIPDTNDASHPDDWGSWDNHDTTIPFKTTDVQREFIHDIKVDMERNGLNQDFIDTACTLAERDQGIYDLLHQYSYTFSLIRYIITDLEASLKDYGYPHKAHDTNPEKPKEEHSYRGDKGAWREDIGDCCYVVRQEIADDKNVMQFEYWCDDGGGWINSKETATLYSRKEASKLACELRNPPSDGRVHIAKRVKKDNTKQDTYVICKPPSGMIEVYQYWDKNRGVLTSDEDYATEYSNPLDADSALAVLSLTRGKNFKGCEVVKRTKIKPSNEVWCSDGVACNTADMVREVKPAVPVSEDAKNHIVYCDRYKTYWCNTITGKWTTDKSIATLMTKKDAEYLAGSDVGFYAVSSGHIGLTATKVETHEEVKVETPEEVKRDHVIYCEQYKAYYSTMDGWSANRDQALLMTKDEAVARLPTTGGWGKIIKVEDIKEEGYYIITRTKLGGAREVLTDFGWSKEHTPKRFFWEAPEKIEHTPLFFTFEEAEKKAISIRKATYDTNAVISIEKGNR